MNLSSTIGLLKELEWAGDVQALMADYINGRANDTAEFWDLSESLFGSEVRDEDVRAAFTAKLATFSPAQDLGQTLIRIGKSKSWSEPDIDFLASKSPDEFYNLFKALRGNDLKRAVSGSLIFYGTNELAGAAKTFTERVTAALIRIGQESPINQRRVPQKGVELPHP